MSGHDPPLSSALDVGFTSLSARNGASDSRAASASSSRRSERSAPRSSGETSTPREAASATDAAQHSGGDLRRREYRPGGFILEPLSANGSPYASGDRHGKRNALDANRLMDRAVPVYGRLSQDSSQRSSPLSRSSPLAVSQHGEQHNDSASARPSSVDPAQLVQMALNLSQSRKRNVSSSASIPVPAGRRSVSRPISTSTTASMGRAHLSGTRDSSDPVNISVTTDDGLTTPATDAVVYTFSPATLSRAEKARKYFEQANEYRRLLQCLPPLKAENVSHRGFEGADGQGLGRPYNPIQSLRNRETRKQARKTLPNPEQCWQSTGSLKRWVNEIEAGTRRSPSNWSWPPLPVHQEAEDAQKEDLVKGRRRADTVSSVITRPENSWMIEPSELLADIYWTEMDDNRHLLEDRRGRPLLGRRERKNSIVGRSSVETSHDIEDVDADDLDEDDGRRPSRRRKLIMPLKSTDPRRHKRLLTRTSSFDSFTSAGSPGRAKKARRASVEEGIGPLERYMQQRIAKEEREAKGEFSSPEVGPAGDRWGLMQRHDIARPRRASILTTGNRTSLDVPRGDVRRPAVHGRIDSGASHALSSADGSDTLDAISPVITGTTFSNADLDQADKRSASDPLRSKRSKFGFLGNHINNRTRVARTDFAPGANGAPLEPILSADTGTQRLSLDSKRPNYLRRHKTSDSNSSSLLRADTNITSTTSGNSAKDNSSTVGRFLKSGRIGGFGRSDGTRFGGDRRKGRPRAEDDPATDVERNAWDESDRDGGSAFADLQKQSTNESISSHRPSLERVWTQPKYHLGNLPAFISSARDKRAAGTGSPTSTLGEFMDRPPNAQSRPLRPRIVLPDDTSASNPELAKDPASAVEQGARKNYGLLQADSARHGSLNSQRPGPSTGQRHWSISDQGLPTLASTRIRKRDVARAKALLLSSGIKAHAILLRADLPRDRPNPLLVRAAATADRPLPRVPRKEDDLTAARLLSDAVDARTSALEAALSHFQSHTAATLGARIDALHARIAGDGLTGRVHELSDAADASVVELTTRRPMQAKQVDDAIDGLLRLRRRQFRLLRRAGFKLLEWLVLGLMWGIWALVTALNLLRRLVVGFFALARWLFSL